MVAVAMVWWSGLADCYGEEFDRLYERYEREGRAKKTVRAQDLWFAILDAQIETGTPYMLVGGWVMRRREGGDHSRVCRRPEQWLMWMCGPCAWQYKDACNRKSNQKNLGTIR